MSDNVSDAKEKKSTTAQFRLEDRMLAVVHRKLGALLIRGQRRLVARKLKLPVGMIVPDSVMVTHSRSVPPSPKHRRLSQFDCAVFATIRKLHHHTMGELSHRVYARHAVVQASVNKLARHRLVVLRGEKVFARPSSRLRLAKIVAVEAKLIKWRDAIRQAQSYLIFSDSSYVALPSALVSRNKKIARSCKTAGVGLISVDGKSCQIAVRARSHRPNSAEWFWALDRTIGVSV